MEKKVFTVNIGEENSRKMEKIWYEYNASLSIVEHLMQSGNVPFENLQDYLMVTEARFTESEKMKEALAKEFKPEEVDLTKYNYSFDFDNFSIVFTEA